MASAVIRVASLLGGGLAAIGLGAGHGHHVAHAPAPTPGVHHHGGPVPGPGGGWAPVIYGQPYLLAPPLIFAGPVGGYPTPPPPVVSFGPIGGGLMLPDAVPNRVAEAPQRPRVRPVSSPAKADGYVAIGDNLFRAANYPRAEQRYLQALRANPNSATPRVRLAQVSLVRGDYRDAAEMIRAASTAEPGWLVNASDVQALYAEPGDLAKSLAKLEAHLQGHPNDRDGWLVLGAELFLSGKTRQASDVFTRLNDRRPDPTLAAFLDAATPDAPAPSPRPSPAP